MLITNGFDYAAMLDWLFRCFRCLMLSCFLSLSPHFQWLSFIMHALLLCHTSLSLMEHAFIRHAMLLTQMLWSDMLLFSPCRYDAAMPRCLYYEVFTFFYCYHCCLRRYAMLRLCLPCLMPLLFIHAAAVTLCHACHAALLAIDAITRAICLRFSHTAATTLDALFTYADVLRRYADITHDYAAISIFRWPLLSILRHTMNSRIITRNAAAGHIAAWLHSAMSRACAPRHAMLCMSLFWFWCQHIMRAWYAAYFAATPSFKRYWCFCLMNTFIMPLLMMLAMMPFVISFNIIVMPRRCCLLFWLFSLFYYCCRCWYFPMLSPPAMFSAFAIRYAAMTPALCFRFFAISSPSLMLTMIIIWYVDIISTRRHLFTLHQQWTLLCRHAAIDICRHATLITLIFDISLWCECAA